MARRIGTRRKGILFDYDRDCAEPRERWRTFWKRYWKRWLRRYRKRAVPEATENNPIQRPMSHEPEVEGEDD